MACQRRRDSVEKKGGNYLTVQNLPTDVLLLIVDYLQYDDLIRLSHSCKRFYSIIKDDSIWVQRSRNALVTNLLSDQMKTRICHSLLPRERVRLSRNWKTGRFKEDIKFYLDNKYMPWLCMGNDMLWISKGNTIVAFRKKSHQQQVDLNRRSTITLHGHEDDVCRFIYKDGVVVSGGRDASIYGFSADSGRILFHSVYAHHSDVTAVDYNGHIVVSGAKDRTFKVWKVLESERSNGSELSHQLTVGMSDRILSSALRPMADECMVGSTGLLASPLHLYNLQRGIEVLTFEKNFKLGAGVLDINWETPHTVLTTGYDTYIRLWDCRTGRNEVSWGDPFDSTVYCLASDNQYTILSGTCNHGRVQLWDQRQSNSVQMFFLSSRYNKNSSIYSLTFDPCNLYAALDQTLNVLDFTGYRNKATNMSNYIL